MYKYFRLSSKKKTGKIIFCGHSFAGGVAGIATLLTAKYLKQKQGLKQENILEKLLAVTIGAPLFADEKARKYWEKEIQLQYHIVSNTKPDIVPPLLTLKCWEELKQVFQKEECWGEWILSWIQGFRKTACNSLQPKKDQPEFSCLGNFYFIGDQREKCYEHLPYDDEKLKALRDSLHNSTQTIIGMLEEIEYSDSKKDIIIQGHCKREYKKKVSRIFPIDPKSTQQPKHDKDQLLSNEFKPKINNAKLIKPEEHDVNGKYILHLRGENLNGIVVKKCHFKFDFEIMETSTEIIPFADGSIKLSFNKKKPNKGLPVPSTSPINEEMTLVTHFGECQFKLEQDNDNNHNREISSLENKSWAWSIPGIWNTFRS